MSSTLCLLSGDDSYQLNGDDVARTRESVLSREEWFDIELAHHHCIPWSTLRAGWNALSEKHPGEDSALFEIAAAVSKTGLMCGAAACHIPEPLLANTSR
jgi:hypothetical protein